MIVSLNKKTIFKHIGNYIETCTLLTHNVHLRKIDSLNSDMPVCHIFPKIPLTFPHIPRSLIYCVVSYSASMPTSKDNPLTGLCIDFVAWYRFPSEFSIHRFYLLVAFSFISYFRWCFLNVLQSNADRNIKQTAMCCDTE